MGENWVRVIAFALVFAAVLLLVAAAVADFAMRRVPNVLPALLAAAGLGLHFLGGSPALGIAIAAVVFAAGAFCWRRGWMGGADVKLLAAAALLVSPRLVPDLMLAIALAGGVLALLYLAARKFLPKVRQDRRGIGQLARFLRRERVRIEHGRLPYAAAIAAGALAVLIK